MTNQPNERWWEKEFENLSLPHSQPVIDFISHVESSTEERVRREQREEDARSLNELPVHLVDIRENPDDRPDYKQAVLLSDAASCIRSKSDNNK